MTFIPVNILRRADNALVSATLRDGVQPETLTAIEQQWRPHRILLQRNLMQLGIDQRNWPQSLHWDWNRKGPELRLLESNGFVLEFEGSIQGVMLTKTASYFSMLDKGKPLVYIDYLESAPWNWNIRELEQVGEYRGVGSVLFYFAVMQSEQEGFHGRVGLHALPQAESFYAGQECRMTKIGLDPNKQNLPYYELSRIEAVQHIRNGGGT